MISLRIASISGEVAHSRSTRIASEFAKSCKARVAGSVGIASGDSSGFLFAVVAFLKASLLRKNGYGAAR